MIKNGIMKLFNLKNINKLFYYLLTISFTIYILPPRWKLAVYTPNLLGYILIVCIVLLVLLLLILILFNIKKNGFLKGFKESSLNIFSFTFIIVICFFVTNSYAKKSDKINVEVFNQSNEGISNIKLIGRKDKAQIDTLAPFDKKKIVFYGRNVIYRTRNDYENEITLRFYFKGKWVERKILSEFSRWRILNKEMEIVIHSADSIVTSLSQ